jgi:phosphatidylserine/phosphatidylglycerophosphate/cardiolipin synthase-like enzyme
MQPAERERIDSLTTQETGFVTNLHAKCYLNETTAIVTSMNLYEFSQQNNDEMGILVTWDADRQLYQDIYAEAQRLGRNAGLR